MPFVDMLSSIEEPGKAFLRALAAQLAERDRYRSPLASLGSGLSKALEFGLEASKQKKLDQLHELQLEDLLTKQRTSKAEKTALASIVKDIKANPDSRASDIFYKYIDKAPSLLDDVLTLQKTEAAQEESRIKAENLSRVGDFLAGQTDDPFKAALFGSGLQPLITSGVSLMGQEARAGASRQREDDKQLRKSEGVMRALEALGARAPQSGSGQAASGSPRIPEELLLSQRTELPPDVGTGEIQLDFTDPGVYGGGPLGIDIEGLNEATVNSPLREEPRNLKNVEGLSEALMEMVRQNPTEANLGRAIEGLKLKLSDKDRQQVRADRNRRRREASRKLKPFELPSGDLAEISSDIVDSADERLSGLDIKGFDPFGPGDDTGRVKSFVSSKLLELTSAGVPPDTARRHLEALLVYSKRANKSLDQILQSSLPSASIIMNFDKGRASEDSEDIQRAFFNRYGYIPF